MAETKQITVREVLVTKLLGLGLYDETRAEELVKRVEGNESGMLKILGRLAVEAARGGSGVQQCIRAILNTKEIPEALETYSRLLSHELDDESHPRA